MNRKSNQTTIVNKTIDNLIKQIIIIIIPWSTIIYVVFKMNLLNIHTVSTDIVVGIAMHVKYCIAFLDSNIKNSNA